jgi:hypothetical protein
MSEQLEFYCRKTYRCKVNREYNRMGSFIRPSVRRLITQPV